MNSDTNSQGSSGSKGESKVQKSKSKQGNWPSQTDKKLAVNHDRVKILNRKQQQTKQETTHKVNYRYPTKPVKEPVNLK